MEKGLKQRLATGLIMAPIAIFLIVVLPNQYFAMVLAMFFIMGAWEWAALVTAPSRAVRISYTALIITFMIAGWFALHTYPLFIKTVVTAAVVWWLLILVLVLSYPKFTSLWKPALTKALAGMLILLPPWLAMVSLHGSSAKGPYYALYVFMMIWLADSAAYFFGRRFGKHKLAPKVSPGKSWEGALGALLAVLVYALIACYFMGIYQLTTEKVIMYLALSLFTVVISILGDLAESMFKRQAQLKDSGSLLPGHGGVLDRFDSLTSAAPWFLLGFWWLSSVEGGLQLASSLEAILR